jgi:CheY-like chemotaxis protein
MAAPPSERILIVDDDPETTRALGQLLVKRGYAVLEEHDSMRALAVAREFQPHAVILDYLMPRAHGGDVAWQLASEPLLRNTRIIICSGHPPSEIVRKLPPAPIPIIGKPVDFDVLVELIRASDVSSAAAQR